MRYSRADAAFRRMLTEAGMAGDALHPWEAWKVFKRFLREPIDPVLDGTVDDALVQYGRYRDATGEQDHLYFVRQFSEAAPAEEEDEAVPLTHIICDLAFPPDVLEKADEVELWSMDYPALDAFIDAVEAAPAFQAFMNRKARASSVYVEEN